MIFSRLVRRAVGSTVNPLEPCPGENNLKPNVVLITVLCNWWAHPEVAPADTRLVYAWSTGRYTYAYCTFTTKSTVTRHKAVGRVGTASLSQVTKGTSGCDTQDLTDQKIAIFFSRLRRPDTQRNTEES